MTAQTPGCGPNSEARKRAAEGAVVGERSTNDARFGPNPGKHRDDCAWTLNRHTCSCEYPRYVEALEALARDYIYAAVEGALDNDDPGWDEYPELPEFVWEDLRERVSLLVSNPYARESAAAYRALSALATKEA